METLSGFFHLEQATLWTALVLVITALTLVIIERWWNMGKLERLGYTGPPRNLLYGNIKELAELNGDHQNGWKKLIEKYGSQVGNLKGKSLALYTGSIPIVVVTNVEVIKFVGIKNFKDFPNRLFAKNRRDDSLLGLADDRWRYVRQTMTPTFTPAKMKLMTDTINGSISVTMDIIEDYVKEDKPVDIYSLFHGLTLEVIGKCALAINVESQKNPDNELLADCIEAFHNFRSNSFGRTLASLFPSFTLFIREYFGMRLGSIIPSDKSLLVRYIRTVIKERKENKGPKTIDALQLMLEAADLIASEDSENDMKNGTTKEGKPLQNGNGPTSEQQKMTDDEVVHNACVFLLAGYETTSTMLAFTSYLLAKHPDVQQRLYEEIKLHCQNESDLSYDTVMQMEYLDMVSKESLRFYPPIADSIIREVKEDCEFEGLKFPKDAWVIFPISYMHYDEELWPNPKTFDPERFHPDRIKDIHVSAFLPFGLGPRKCIGTRFALMEAKMAITRLIQRYRVETCDLTEENIKTSPGKISLSPQSSHIYLKCVRR